MSNLGDSQAVSHSLFYTIELLEMILLNLDARNIVKVSGVCKFWNDCCQSTPKLLRKTYKLAVKLDDDVNPHFKTPSKKSRNALIPRHPRNPSRHAGTEVLGLYEAADIEYLSSIQPGLDISTLDAMAEDYAEKRKHYRFGFMDFRFPNGWPSEYYQIHCNVCDGFHAKFNFENLHPLLSFLENLDLCVRGNGTQMFFRYDFVSDYDSPKSCYEHICANIRYLGRSLELASGLLDRCNLKNDLFTRPICTRLVGSDFDIIENPGGITLLEVISFLTRRFKSSLLGCQSSLDLLPDPSKSVSRHWRIVRDQRAAYPTEEDWEVHRGDCDEIRAIFNAAIDEVNAWLRGIPAWDEKTLYCERQNDVTEET